MRCSTDGHIKVYPEAITLCVVDICASTVMASDPHITSIMPVNVAAASSVHGEL
jgi:hypothetical protein